MVFISYETTDKISIFILLNSSKQAHNPLAQTPLKNFDIASKSRVLEQLNTKQGLPIFLASSLTVSVLPVPAGPTGAPQ